MSEGDRSETDELAEIRARKRERLRERMAGEPAGNEPGEAETSGDPTPDEPVGVGGAAALRSLVADHDVVLVDFYADWCGPCRMLEPVVERVAATTGAAVAKVDIDAAADLARTYGVQGVPTLLLFADGDPAERLVGPQDEATLRDLIGRYA